ncbi:Bug family tripartite tricarboxylate transporter substrate binding protein [Jiella sonneratiae]|uniref:Tripartite tricarboxylate transporter substrate binding protein n=1 Tax=Jiella sonneratiae TaxID=2816856 RepID=A0ABS3J8A5_9HYPH|nr:tripartite tricarboxylate transporter substrate binding protein [Jiella sonneratiae]MBO0905901.1 tripartite tricarboxylate transporter substrate binding protein [Jiella sonneratiae]
MSTKFTRRQALRLAAGSGLAATALAAPRIARAQSSYPEQPINVVVPFDTGGYNDRLARAFTPFLQERLGQPLVVVNRGGAGALLGHTYFLQQPDDGYTILCTSAAPYMPLNILLQGAQFKISDFQMINLPSRDYTLMATEAGSELKSVDDVIAKLKADPSSLSIGVQPASADLVNLMLWADANGISRDGLRIVTYDGGGPARNAAAGGVVDIGLVGGEGFLPLAEKIRPLLIFDSEKRDNWDAPNSGERGVSKSVSGSQRGWAVHASMKESHPDRYEILVKAIEETSKDPKVVESLTKQQLATEWYGPEASQESLRQTAEVMEQHVDLLKGA